MAISGKVRVSDLLPEFLADALVFLGALQPARAIAAGAFQAFPDGLHHFLILVESDSHRLTSLLAQLYHAPPENAIYILQFLFGAGCAIMDKMCFGGAPWVFCRYASRI